MKMHASLLILFLILPAVIYCQMKMDMPIHDSRHNQKAFTLSKRQSKTLSEAQVLSLETAQMKGKVIGERALFFEENQQIVVRTGSAEDMLSYRIQGIRNPTLGIKTGSEIRILFVNTDDDMNHDIRFSRTPKSWSLSPDTSATVGTYRLPPSQNNTYSAEEILITVNDSGSFSYFCSVKGHASGGMTGRIVVGNDPETIINTMPKDTSPSMSQNHNGMNMHHAEMKMDSNKMDMGAMNMGSMPAMQSEIYQTGSGTSWVPATTPLYALMYDFPNSSLMIHGGIFPRYTYQSGSRGDKEFGAPNWIMLMYDNNLDRSNFLELRGMFSADPLIEGNRGYPLLLQTGEGLHDRQHPHDLFDELAVSYTHKFSGDVSVNIYGGMPGEPALGASAFMHRTSAMSNPDASLSHHWQDATHITFGVATIGIQYKNVKLEGSIFNGREPDSNRYDIDKPRFDSYSGRLSYNPTDELSFQASYGLLKNVEGDSIDINRITVSAIYTRKIDETGWWSSTIAFGQNKQVLNDPSNSILIESQWNTNQNNIYGRVEYIQKYLNELLIPGSGTAGISEITLGFSRTLATIAMINIDLGVQATYNIIPESFKLFYGNSPYGAQIYFSIHPTIIKGEMHH
jgi:plastocyanin